MVRFLRLGPVGFDPRSSVSVGPISFDADSFVSIIFSLIPCGSLSCGSIPLASIPFNLIVDDIWAPFLGFDSMG